MGTICLAYSSAVEGLLIFTGVGGVFLVGRREVMIAGEILFRTHIQIVMLLGIQNGIDCSHARGPNRTRRQTLVAVGVVGGVGLQMP